MGFDQKIGTKLREKRKQMGMTLDVLSKRMGISLPQMQKYEAGATKLSPKSIYELSKIFSVKPNYFFEDLGLEEAFEKTNAKNKPAPLRVLIIDDNPSDTCLTQAALQESQKEIITFEIRDPEEVIPTINRRAFPTAFMFPDLILLDLQMPKMHGLDLLKRLKKDRVSAHVPVVVLSNTLNRQEMQQAYENFAAGYIPKPFEIKEYKEKLMKLVDYWADAAVLPGSN
jgi:CheY-like chemotaxis protein